MLWSKQHVCVLCTHSVTLCVHLKAGICFNNHCVVPTKTLINRLVVWQQKLGLGHQNNWLAVGFLPKSCSSHQPFRGLISLYLKSLGFWHSLSCLVSILSYFRRNLIFVPYCSSIITSGVCSVLSANLGSPSCIYWLLRFFGVCPSLFAHTCLQI